MNTEAMGICRLKKGMCTENVKNACSHTLYCQNYSSSFFLLLFILGNSLGAEMFVQAFCTTVCDLAMSLGEEYFAVQEP